MPESNLTLAEARAIAVIAIARTRHRERPAWAARPSTLAEHVSRGAWRPAPHLLFIEEKILAMLAGEIPPLLLISTPPRHGKSELCSHWLPVWAHDQHPDWPMILASHGADWAAHWGRVDRDTIADAPELSVRLSADSRAADHWYTTAGGMLTTAGVGGSITGRGAKLLIIDDAIKDAEEASSVVYRERAWDWWRSTARTRLEPGGVVVVIGTRWHQDDLIGRLIASGQPHTAIRLPAIAEADDPLGRAEGEALWPERFDIAALEAIKASVGAYWWAAEYQGRPIPAEGGIIKREQIRYWLEPPQCERLIQSWDMAFKDARQSDYVVGQVWGTIGADCFLVDQVRGRWDFVATIDAVRRLSVRYPQALAKLVEDSANGPAVISMLQSEVAGLIAERAVGSKESRLSAVSPLFEAGNVYLPNPAMHPWVEDLVEELVGFPSMPHDDQVDALSQGLLRLHETKAVNFGESGFTQGQSYGISRW